MGKIHIAIFVAAAIAAAALGGCRPPADKNGDQPAAESTAPDPADLNVEIGRYGVMLDQVQSLTQERTGSEELDPVAPRELGRALREAVWRFNIERSQLCAKGLFAELACGPPYEPVWISEPSDVEPTLEEVQSRSAALGEEIQRFWTAVCEDAASRVRDRRDRAEVCAIE